MVRARARRYDCVTASPEWRDDLAASGALTVYSYNAFEPVIYDEGKGFEADLLRAVATKLGLAARFEPTAEFDGMWRRVLERPISCDLASGGFSDTPQRRAEGVAFTVPHYKNVQTLLVRASDATSLRDYADFDDARQVIGVVPGTTGEIFARQRASEAGRDPARLVRGLPTELELVRALRDGSIDAIARGAPGNLYQASLSADVAVVAFRDFGERFAFAADPARPRLLTAIDEAIRSVTKDGRVSLEDWLGNPNVFGSRTAGAVPQ